MPKRNKETRITNLLNRVKVRWAGTQTRRIATCRSVITLLSNFCLLGILQLELTFCVFMKFVYNFVPEEIASFYHFDVYNLIYG